MFIIVLFLYVVLRVAFIQPYFPEDLHNTVTLIAWLIPGYITATIYSNAANMKEARYPQGFIYWVIALSGPLLIFNALDRKLENERRERDRRWRKQEAEERKALAEEFRKKFNPE